MNRIKTDSRRIGAGITAVLLLACAVLDAGAYWVLRHFSDRVTNPDQETLGRLAQWALELREGFWLFFVPVSLLFFGALALVIWLMARRAISRAARPTAAVRPSAQPKESDERAAAAQDDLHQRLFLHLLAVLQREGRIMDFFFENLAEYSDAQIGTAVRGIHENCRKVIEKYLAPQSVVRESEGDAITVEEGFDPSALKLTGNVTGAPPFRGTVRHRGWKVRKLELPTLSGSPDPKIIAPAEVEVL